MTRAAMSSRDAEVVNERREHLRERRSKPSLLGALSLNRRTATAREVDVRQRVREQGLPAKSALCATR